MYVRSFFSLESSQKPREEQGWVLFSDKRDEEEGTDILYTAADSEEQRVRVSGERQQGAVKRGIGR
jgi:hypothetical protein